MIYLLTEGDGDDYCVRAAYEGPDGQDIAVLKRRFAQKSVAPGKENWEAFSEFLVELGFQEVEHDEIWLPW